MKKRVGILCLFVAAFVVFAMLPLQASAATSNSAAFASLTVADVMKKYNKPLPKGGTKQSAAQIRSTLASIGYKIPGKGTVYTNCELSFSTTNGALYRASKYASWEKNSSKSNNKYTEYTILYDAWENPAPAATYCMLYKVIGKTYYTYHWDKGAAKGESYSGTGKMTKSSPAPKAPELNNLMTGFKTYKDAKVLGQKCFVYSYKYKGSKTTTYCYISRKTGQMLKTVYVYSGGYVDTTVYFVQKNVSKGPDNFAAPVGVAFTGY